MSGENTEEQSETCGVPQRTLRSHYCSSTQEIGGKDLEQTQDCRGGEKAGMPQSSDFHFENTSPFHVPDGWEGRKRLESRNDEI